MSCCKRVGGTFSQPANNNSVKPANSKPAINTGVKSNRTPAGTIARQCSNCGTKTVVSICPVCFLPINTN